MLNRAALVFLLFLASLPLFARERPWHVAASPRFTVYSQLGEKPTREWMVEFDQFIASLERLFAFDERRLVPLTIVLMARDKDFAAYKFLRPDGKVNEDLAGFFASRSGWSVVGLAEHRDDEETRRVIFHEGVHWLSNAAPLPNPLWIEEGIAEVYSTFRIARGEAEWGHGIGGHVFLLQNRPLIPLRELVAARRDGALFNDADRGGLVYAQAWLFAHYLLFAEREELGEGKGFAAYLAASRRDIPLPEAFIEGFGVDHAAMEARLKRYLSRGRYFLRRVPAEATGASTTAITSAVPSDVHLALVKLALGGGRPETAAEQARLAVERHPGDSASWFAAALVADARGEHARAVEAAGRALELGSSDPALRLLRVSAEFNQLVEDGGVPPADGRRLANEVARVINQRPFLREAYPLFGDLVIREGVARRTDFDFLDQGCRLFPGLPHLRLLLAQLARTLERPEDAARLLAALRAEFESLPASLPKLVDQLDELWTVQDMQDSINVHSQAGRLAEAVAAADELLARRLDPMQRALLGRRRAQLDALEKYERAKSAIQAGRIDEARPLLTGLKDSSALPPAVRADIERKLGALVLPAP